MICNDKVKHVIHHEDGEHLCDLMAVWVCQAGAVHLFDETDVYFMMLTLFHHFHPCLLEYSPFTLSVEFFT